MGKTPRKASAGIMVALLMSAGCQSTPTPTQGTMQQQAQNRSQTWGSQNSTGGTNTMTQGGSTGLPNQVASNQLNSRPQTGQNVGSTGNFQNNFTNSAQPSGGFNQQNTGPNNIQPASFGQNSGGVQQAPSNSTQNAGGVQQAGGWASNTQAQQTGSGVGRSMSRNTDDVYGGGNAGSAPPPSWPSGGSAGNGANSLDPPAVAPANGSGYNTKSQPLPFNASRSGSY